MHPLLVIIFCCSLLKECVQQKKHSSISWQIWPAGRHRGPDPSLGRKLRDMSKHIRGSHLVYTFGAGLLLIPTKPFVDIGELAIDQLGLPLTDDSTKSSHSRSRSVNSIVKWPSFPLTTSQYGLKHSLRGCVASWATITLPCRHTCNMKGTAGQHTTTISNRSQLPLLVVCDCKGMLIVGSWLSQVLAVTLC